MEMEGGGGSVASRLCLSTCIKRRRYGPFGSRAGGPGRALTARGAADTSILAMHYDGVDG